MPPINKYGPKKGPRTSVCQQAAQKALRLAFQKLLAGHWMSAFAQARVGHRVAETCKAMISLGGARGTVTNSIVARGRDQEDWSAYYRAFSQGCWDPVDLFHGVFRAVVPELPETGPVVLALDDTGLPKAGEHISGAGWIHNPLCPKWIHPAIQWGLPMFHATVLIPIRAAHRPLAITVGFEPIPREQKDPKESAKMEGGGAGGSPVGEPALTSKKRGRPTKEEVSARRAAEGISNKAITEIKATATTIAIKTIHRVRQWMDEEGLGHRTLLVVADGSYTNGTVMLNLPDRTEYVGRTRPDTRLQAMGEKIRKDGPQYGPDLPTPETMAINKALPVIQDDFHYGGDVRKLNYLAVGPVYRKNSTQKKPLRLLILEPVPFGKGKSRGYNYRAYLLTTDFQMATSTLVQAYLDRWSIEVLHRDLKSGLGMGQAQAMAPGSVKRVHAALAAYYGLLLLAILKSQGQVRTEGFGHLPKWVQNWRKWRARTRLAKGKPEPVYRPSVTDITTLFRQAYAPVGVQILRLIA